MYYSHRRRAHSENDILHKFFLKKSCNVVDKTTNPIIEFKESSYENKVNPSYINKIIQKLMEIWNTISGINSSIYEYSFGKNQKSDLHLSSNNIISEKDDFLDTSFVQNSDDKNHIEHIVSLAAIVENADFVIDF
ncbi:MAG: hypothetical protein ISN64_00330 [Rickettsia sp.]|nr:hypothetical protein [Rickettsia sp.]